MMNRREFIKWAGLAAVAAALSGVMRKPTEEEAAFEFVDDLTLAVSDEAEWMWFECELDKFLPPSGTEVPSVSLDIITDYKERRAVKTSSGIVWVHREGDVWVEDYRTGGRDD